MPIHTIKRESRAFAGTTLCNPLLSACCSRAWHSLCGQAARSLLVLRDGASCTDPSLPWALQVRQLPWRLPQVAALEQWGQKAVEAELCPFPGHRERGSDLPQSLGVPFPQPGFPGALRSPSSGSCQHCCFLSGFSWLHPVQLCSPHQKGLFIEK